MPYRKYLLWMPALVAVPASLGLFGKPLDQTSRRYPPSDQMQVAVAKTCCSHSVIVRLVSRACIGVEESSMAKIMMTIQSKSGPPSLAAIRARYGLADDEIDPQFGVVEIDPADGTYAILIEETAAAKITNSGDWKVQGPYSNPKIAPFGPPKTNEDPEDPF